MLLLCQCARGQGKTQFLFFSLNMLSVPTCSAKLHGLISILGEAVVLVEG